MKKIVWAIATTLGLSVNELTASPEEIAIVPKHEGRFAGDKEPDEYTVSFGGEPIGRVDKECTGFYTRSPEYKFSVSDFEIPSAHRNLEKMREFVKARIATIINDRKVQYREVFFGGRRVAVYSKIKRTLYILDEGAARFSTPMEKMVYTDISWTSAHETAEQIFSQVGVRADVDIDDDEE